jgi:hypothetical protein
VPAPLTVARREQQAASPVAVGVPAPLTVARGEQQAASPVAVGVPAPLIVARGEQPAASPGSQRSSAALAAATPATQQRPPGTADAEAAAAPAVALERRPAAAGRVDPTDTPPALPGAVVEAPRRLARVPIADLPALQRRARALSSAVAGSDGSEPDGTAQPPTAERGPGGGSPAGTIAPTGGDHRRYLPVAAASAQAPALARHLAAAPATAGEQPPRPQLMPAPGPPPLQRQESPDAAPIDAAALARLTGGTLSQTPSGSSTVSFLARSEDPRPEPATVVAAASAAPPDAISVEGEERPLRIDELYDRIVKRLRRELLDDRERRGRLIGEGRW